MKTKKALILAYLGIFLISMLAGSCKKDDTDDNNSTPSGEFPTTDEQIAVAIQNTNRIAIDGGALIEVAISNAYTQNGVVDPNIIASQVVLIDGVVSAVATPSGTGIVVKQDDGTYTNLLVVTQDDERLFIKEDIKGAGLDKQEILILKDNTIIPNGSGKALILAPFHDDFGENLQQISNLLASAGFEVDKYENGDADLAKFNGEFLNNYDVVYISTHGSASSKTRGGTESTILLTGEEYTLAKVISLSEAEQRAIATASHDGITSLFAISAPWINLTTNQNFTNSWIYADACESAMTDNGAASMSAAFLSLGAVGYNGFDETINTILANAITEKMLARFTSGLTFNDASDEVRNDLGLQATSWVLRLLGASTAKVDLFDNNKNITDPFYLVNPEDVVGTAQVIPNSGPVGTAAVYEVIINANYISQVANVEFDIDNTGEHLEMVEVSSGKWERDELAAPPAESYPRIDTFTFSAFDAVGNLIGQGSATFSILEGGKSLAGNPSKYYAK
jgi:hypothetical protein